MMKNMIAMIIWFAVFVLGIAGWIFNLVKLFHLDVFSGGAIARAIGVIIPPVGAILGYF